MQNRSIARVIMKGNYERKMALYVRGFSQVLPLFRHSIISFLTDDVRVEICTGPKEPFSLWWLCDGSTVSRTEYQGLFPAVSMRYGFDHRLLRCYKGQC